MTTAEANQVVNSLAVRCQREWSDARLALFTHDLLESSIGGLPFDVVSNTLRRLVGEIAPDDVTLSKLIEAVKTKPVVPDRPRLEAEDRVDPTATGPAARGFAWRRRHGIEAPKNRPMPTIRAEIAQILGSLGERMGFRCIRCQAPFAQIDVDAYVLRCMDAGAGGDPEPRRWCARCTPATEVDDAIPF